LYYDMSCSGTPPWKQHYTYQAMAFILNIILLW